MAQKSLGYVELEWVCPNCNTRNPGSSRTCQGCGAPQPADVKFVAPAQAQIIQDQAVVKQAAAGADIHCPYCGARNPAGAKVCHQCGGDLTKAVARQSGEVVAGFSTTGPATVKCPACGTENPSNLKVCKNCGAPLPGATPAPAIQATPASGGNSCLYIIIGAAVLLVIGIFLFFMLAGGGKQTASVGKVVDSHWLRTVEIMALRPRQHTAWADEIPADATIGSCTDEVREEVDEPTANSREVCGTPYAVDQGNGFAKEVQDCKYQVLAQQCQYTVNEWQVINVAKSQGNGLTAAWPQLTNSRERQGDRDEEYDCVFSANDKTYTYRMSSYEDFQKCIVGTTWNLVTTESGRVISATPAE
jgi:ribosomal protein L40E